MPYKEDRRITKTKQSIKDAFISLLEDQTIESITVSSITTQAQINRSTFYAHYTDIYALQQEIEDTFIQDIAGLLLPPETNDGKVTLEQTAVYKIFKYMQEHQRLCNILFKETSNSAFILRLAQKLQNSMLIKLPSEAQNTPAILQNYASSFIVYGIIGIMHRWVLDDGVITPEEITRFSLLLTNK